MKRLHLCIVSETYPPEINGVALTVQSMVENLVRLGHRVSLIRPQPKQAQAQVSDSQTQFPMFAELQVGALALPRYPGLQLGKPATARIREHLQTQQVDAVYVATEGPLGWSARRAALALRTPLITGFHTRFDLYMAHYRAAWLGKLARSYLRYFHSRADLTVAPTEELTLALHQMGIPKAIHLQRGVNTERFNPALRCQALRASWGAGEATPVIIGVGRIAAEKNLPMLLATYQQHAKHHDTKLVIVGDGPLKAELQQQHPNVIFTGQLLGAELARAYASADIFAMPSLSETFGNVTLEAMASSLAVVAFDYGAAKAFVSHGQHGSTVAMHGDDALQQQRSFASALDFEISRWRLGARVGQSAREAILPMHPLRCTSQFVTRIQALIDQRKNPHELRKSYRQMA